MTDTEERSPSDPCASAWTEPAVDDPRLTTIGLLFESSAGLRRIFQQQLDTDTAVVTSSFDVLIRLVRTPGGELRMSELASQASLTPSGLTRSVDRLCHQGLVERRMCPNDRRGTLAVLTPAGQQLMAELLPRHQAAIGNVLDEIFSPDEEEQLHNLLRKLRDYVVAANAHATGDACPGSSEDQ